MKEVRNHCFFFSFLFYIHFIIIDRRPIEPPPILQLRWDHATEEELK